MKTSHKILASLFVAIVCALLLLTTAGCSTQKHTAQKPVIEADQKIWGQFYIRYPDGKVSVSMEYGDVLWVIKTKSRHLIILK